MSTRSTTRFYNVNVNVVGVNKSNPSGFPTNTSYEMPMLNETLESTSGYFRSFNKVWHEKWEYFFPHVSFSYGARNLSYYANIYDLWSISGLFNNSSSTDASNDIVSGDYTDSLDLDDLSAQAVQNMWPEVDNYIGESILNSFLDIPATRRLSSEIDRVTRKSSMRILMDAAKRNPKAALKTLVRSMAESTLIYQYGIKTLVSDVAGITDGMALVRKDVNRLLANANKQVVSHSRVPLTTVKTVTRDTTDIARRGIYNNPILRRRFVYTTKHWYTATMRYRYTIPDWMAKQAYTLGRLDAVGLSLNPRIIWDAIPFSFVVDWFVKVGDFLQQMNWRNLDPRVSILQFGASTKTECYCDVTSQMLNGIAPSSAFTNLELKYTAYRRFPYVPNTFRGFQTGSLTAYKTGIGSSLILAKLLK